MLKKLFLFCIPIFIASAYAIPAVYLYNLTIKPNLVYGGEHFYIMFNLKNIAQMEAPVNVNITMIPCDGIYLDSVSVNGKTISYNKYKCLWYVPVVLSKESDNFFVFKYYTDPAIENSKINITITLSSNSYIDVQSEKIVKYIGVGGASPSQVKNIINKSENSIVKRITNKIKSTNNTINKIYKIVKKIVEIIPKYVKIQPVKEEPVIKHLPGVVVHEVSNTNNNSTSSKMTNTNNIVKNVGRSLPNTAQLKVVTGFILLIGIILMLVIIL